MISLGRVINGVIVVKKLTEWFPNTYFAEGTTIKHFPDFMEVVNYIPYDRSVYKLVTVPYYVYEGKIYGVRIVKLTDRDIEEINDRNFYPTLSKKNFILKLFDLGFKDKYDSVTKSEALSERDKLEIELSDTIVRKSELFSRLASAMGLAKEEADSILTE